MGSKAFDISRLADTPTSAANITHTTIKSLLNRLIATSTSPKQGLKKRSERLASLLAECETADLLTRIHSKHPSITESHVHTQSHERADMRHIEDQHRAVDALGALSYLTGVAEATVQPRPIDRTKFFAE